MTDGLMEIAGSGMERHQGRRRLGQADDVFPRIVLILVANRLPPHGDGDRGVDDIEFERIST
jgi:hypothetical protein